MSRTVAVLGAGGHGVVVVATALAAGLSIVGVFDDRAGLRGTIVLNVPVLGMVGDAAMSEATFAVAAIGDNSVRRSVVERVPLEFVSVVHPSAGVAEDVRIGTGSVVFAGATIQPRTSIGDHVIINTGAVADHDCLIEGFVHIAPGAVVCGGVEIGRGALVGAGAVVTPGVTVGEDAVVGAGAVVLGDVLAGTTVAGAPARLIGEL